MREWRGGRSQLALQGLVAVRRLQVAQVRFRFGEHGDGFFLRQLLLLQRFQRRAQRLGERFLLFFAQFGVGFDFLDQLLNFFFLLSNAFLQRALFLQNLGLGVGQPHGGCQQGQGQKKDKPVAARRSQGQRGGDVLDLKGVHGVGELLVGHVRRRLQAALGDFHGGGGAFFEPEVAVGAPAASACAAVAVG